MAKNTNLELTIGDTETILLTFTDSNGDNYTITSYTFTMEVGTTEGGNDVFTKTGGDFSLTSNTATLELSTTDTAQSEGQVWYTISMVDTNSKKTTVAHGNVIFTKERTGQTNSLNVTVGTTTLDVNMVVAFGTQGGLGGDVSGPGSSTDNAIARFDSTTGKIIQNSSTTIDDNGSINIPSGEEYKINNVSVINGLIKSDPTGVTGADQITNAMTLTTAEYAAIGAPDIATLYFITDAT